MAQRFFLIFLGSLCMFASLSLILFHPWVVSVDGDGISYVDAMNTLLGLPLPMVQSAADFALHRILTTFLGLEFIIFLSFIFGKITTAWIVWELILYFLINITFYKLLEKMFRSHRTALIGGLFLASNYAMVTAGLGHFMDIGGWFFYILSIYFLYGYIESGLKRELWLATLSISVGAFFKENSLIAYVPLFWVLAYQNYFVGGQFRKEIFSSTILFLKQIVPLSLVIFIPITIHHIDVYLVFNHGYLYWVKLNQQSYHYASRLIEYVKSFGSLLTFLAPVSFAGLGIIVRSAWNKVGRTRLLEEFGLDGTKALFIISVLISSMPAVMWPGITQRVLFMVVPGTIIIGCFFVKRYETYWYLFLIPVGMYALCSFLMDSVLLGAINLPF